MLPSTNPKASAPRTSTFSVLISPAHPYRYRRFACPLAGTDARLAEKRGSVTPSFQGTYTPYLLPVRLAHRILVLPRMQWTEQERSARCSDRTEARTRQNARFAPIRKTLECAERSLWVRSGITSPFSFRMLPPLMKFKGA